MYLHWTEDLTPEEVDYLIPLILDPFAPDASDDSKPLMERFKMQVRSLMRGTDEQHPQPSEDHVTAVSAWMVHAALHQRVLHYILTKSLRPYWDDEHDRLDLELLTDDSQQREGDA